MECNFVRRKFDDFNKTGLKVDQIQRNWQKLGVQDRVGHIHAVTYLGSLAMIHVQFYSMVYDVSGPVKRQTNFTPKPAKIVKV